MIGYALKPGSESSLEVGGASFAMYTRATGSGSRTPRRRADGQRHAQIRRRYVKGISAKGTETTDDFS
jgi:hypothetical protein